MIRPPEREERIERKLLRDAVPVCVDCHEAIEPGDPKVTVPNPDRPMAPWWRCGDCEYERQRS